MGIEQVIQLVLNLYYLSEKHENAESPCVGEYKNMELLARGVLGPAPPTYR